MSRSSQGKPSLRLSRRHTFRRTVALGRAVALERAVALKRAVALEETTAYG